MKLSKLVQSIDPSITLLITAKAKEMKKQGLDVVSFAAGEPDFDTMWHIKEAAKRAIDEGFTKYTTSSGISELKEAVCAKLRRDNWLDYEKKNILISTGAKQSLFNIILTLVNPGDEVIIPLPYWISYEEMVKIASGRCVFLKPKGEKMTAEELQKTITQKTKLLILCSPSNPSGVVYNEKELKTIASVCVKNHLDVLSDECYEKLIYDGKKAVSIASINDKIKEQTVVVNGVSKTYAMTGWRIGYAAGPEEVIQAAAKIQDHSTSNPCSISQKAALAALNGPQDHIPKMVKEYQRRRDYMVQKLNSIKGVKAQKPEGAFYVFADVSRLYNKKINGSVKFCQELLEKSYVAVVPGAGFGDDHSIRFSFATGLEHIKRGLDRFQKFCEMIK